LLNDSLVEQVCKVSTKHLCCIVNEALSPYVSAISDHKPTAHLSGCHSEPPSVLTTLFSCRWASRSTAPSDLCGRREARGGLSF
jgi:hypothetical protein